MDKKDVKTLGVGILLVIIGLAVIGFGKQFARGLML